MNYDILLRVDFNYVVNENLRNVTANIYNLKRENIYKISSMNYANSLKSPRSTLGTSSVNNQLGEVVNLQQLLLEKDKIISDLQGTINRLELKNKQYSSYQQAMIEYQARTEEVQGQLMKTNEKLRAKVLEYDQVKKKLDQQLKEKKQRATTFVKHEDYMKLSNQYKKFRQVHRACQDSIKKVQKSKQEADSVVMQLRQQIDNLQNVINTKNNEINQLKVQKYTIKSSQSIESQKQLNVRLSHSNSNNNILSPFRISGEEHIQYSKHDPEIEKINYELRAYSRENDQLRQKCQKLEQELQQYLLNSNAWTGKEKNQQYSKIIEEYENSLSNMANKLAAVHRLEMQRNSIEQDRRKFQIQSQQLRQELASRENYCEELEKKIRQIQHYKTAYLQSDIQNFIIRNQKLTKQVQKLEKVVHQKYEQIVELKKNLMTIQVTEETFRLVQLSLTNLQQSLNATKLELSKEQDKVLQKEEQYFKLQKQFKRHEIELAEVKAEMAKTNRVVSQKVQKIEFQTTEIKRLQKQNAEKRELSVKLAHLQAEYKNLEKKYEDQLDESNQLAMNVIVLSAEVERKYFGNSISKEFIAQFEGLKAKAKQTEAYSKYLEQRVKRLQGLHKKVVAQSMKISEHLHNSHKRWNHYDTSMQRLIEFLEQSNEKSNKRYEELDANINTWLNLQEQRLKQLSKSDPLGEIPQYVTYTAKITTQPVILPVEGQKNS